MTELDEKLTELCENTPAHKALSQQQIADYCGCSRSYIYSIERRALRKLSRKTLLKQHLNTPQDQYPAYVFGVSN